MASYEKDKQEILNRLRRMEGQLRGIQRMVERDEYCIDVLTQLTSIMAAPQRVGDVILRDHIQGGVRNSLTDGTSSDVAINELIEAVQRFRRV